MDDICRRIKDLRLKRGLTLAGMAEVIGVSAGNISDWESDKKKSTPASKALIRIAEAFHVSLDWLMTGKPSSHDEVPGIGTLCSIESAQTALSLLADLAAEDLEIVLLLTKRLAASNGSAAGSFPPAIVREQSLATQYYVRLPLVGKVTAGMPTTAVENIEEYVPVPKELVNKENHFVLRVQGDSMMKAGIHDKDLIVVRQQETANNGDIIIALIDGEHATVKTFYKEKDRVRLQPENDSMPPIYTRDIKILGKVTGVLKDMPA